MFHFIAVHIDQVGQFVLAAGIVGLGFIQKKFFKHQQEKAQEIHILVNSQKEVLEARVKELEAQLEQIRNTVQENAQGPEA